MENGNAHQKEAEHTRHVVVESILNDADETIAKRTEESGSGPDKSERLQIYRRSFQNRLADLDRRAFDAISRRNAKNNENQYEALTERLADQDTRLSLMSVVTEAETKNGDEKDNARTAALLSIRTSTGLGENEALALYKFYAANPETLQQVVEIEQAKAVLTHEPNRFDEYVKLLRADDAAALDTFLSEIKSENIAFAERSQALTQHRVVAIERLYQLHPPDVRVSAMLSDDVPLDQLSAGQQVALADALETIDQPVLAAWKSLTFVVDSDGIKSNWLESDLRIQLQRDGQSQVRIGNVPVTGGIGQDFFEAATISRFLQQGSDLDTVKLRSLVPLIAFLGPKYQTPTDDRIDRAERLLRRLEIGNSQTRKRLGVEANGTIDQDRCRLLGKQVAVILDEAGIGSTFLNSETLKRITDYWNANADNPAGILSMAKVRGIAGSDR